MGNVLLVDDEPDILFLMKELLKKHGFKVLDASAGKEGLKLARDNRPDIVLLDAMMPDLNGWEVAKKLKSNPETKDIPIVMITVMAEDKYKKRSFEYAGADWHVPKPFDPDVLFSILDMATQKPTEIEKSIEKAIERDERMKQVFDMINPKLLSHKYDFLDK
ncbi:MAG: PleD family two-component system response regulator [Candidatus Hydrothermarchaeales archaeon]